MSAIRVENVPSCAVCGGTGEKIRENIPDRLFGVEGSFDFRRCDYCGTLWMDPRPVSEDISKCYENYYTHLSAAAPAAAAHIRGRFFGVLRDAVRNMILCGKYGYSRPHTSRQFCMLGKMLGLIPGLASRARYGLRELIPPFVPGGLIVDIGCGNGAYLKQMKELGWRVYGVEPDAKSAAAARDSGVEVFNGSVEHAPIPPASADQVVLNHVIEHLYDPLKILDECHRILKPGGRLVAYTPNASSMAHLLFKKNYMSLDPPRHLFIFSVEGMRTLLGRGRFAKCRVRTSARAAKGIYDSCALIAREGKINFYDVPSQKGRNLFAALERMLCRLGFPVGEEIEVVAVKK